MNQTVWSFTIAPYKVPLGEAWYLDTVMHRAVGKLWGCRGCGPKVEHLPGVLGSLSSVPTVGLGCDVVGCREVLDVSDGTQHWGSAGLKL